MDLRDAIGWVKQEAHAFEREGIHGMGSRARTWKVVIDAAERELARSEAEKPRRASLEKLEYSSRKDGCGADNCQDKWNVRVCCEPQRKLNLQTADVLKALREKVVPFLRAVLKENSTPTTESRTVLPVARCNFVECLEALGEEV